MDRTAGVGLAVYAALVASLATPLYDPLSSGEDDWWGAARAAGVRASRCRRGRRPLVGAAA